MCGGLVVWFGDFVGGVGWICDIVWLVVRVWEKDGANKYQFEGMKRRNKFSGEVINLQKMILIIYNMAHGAIKIDLFIYILPGNIFQRFHVYHCFQCKNHCYKNKVLSFEKKKDHLCPVFKYFSMTKGIKAWLHEAISWSSTHLWQASENRPKNLVKHHERKPQAPPWLSHQKQLHQNHENVSLMCIFVYLCVNMFM